MLSVILKIRESEDHIVAWANNRVLSEDYIILHSESFASEIRWWVFT